MDWYRVVDAPVAGDKAPQQLGVGGVDNGAAGQGGDIPLPEVEALLHGPEAGEGGDPLAPGLLLEIGVLHL